MQVGSKVTAAAVAVAVATFVVVPASVTDSISEDWRRLTGDPGQACFDYERALLADPTGARLHSYSVGVSDASEVTIKYSAKNGVGADAEAEVICAVHAGKVSEAGTVRRREHALAVKRLDTLIAEFDCLEKKKDILRAGKVKEANRVRCSR